MDIDTVVREVDLHKLLDNEESSDLDIEDMPRERFKLKPKKKTVRFDMKTVSATCSVEPIPLTDIDALN